VERGAGRSVVLLHGNPGSVYDFAFGLADDLATEHRVIAVDRPGHGHSTRPADDLDAVAQMELIREGLARLAVANPILVAHSWSGLVALAFAIGYPSEVAALVLIAATTQPPSGSPGVRDLILASPGLGMVAAWTLWPLVARGAMLDNLRMAYAPEAPLTGHADACVGLWARPAQARAAAADSLSMAGSARRLADRYSEVRVPVVLLYGTADPWCRYEDQVEPTASLIDSARVIAVPDAGHELALTHPSVVREAIDAISGQRVTSRHMPDG
jgi:pimeloyl-ACP methyl ester carboxylesterase